MIGENILHRQRTLCLQMKANDIRVQFRSSIEEQCKIMEKNVQKHQSELQELYNKAQSVDPNSEEGILLQKKMEMEESKFDILCKILKNFGDTMSTILEQNLRIID
ncbi:hypothetical protein V8G54_014596 [Vigna mungo]|uniref:Uncharacterized protein n=1 Tax=Vigna mungo TaxID=3915 RepID=A0AAQ3RZD6_VIGMU